MKDTAKKYGIALVERKEKRAPKTGMSSGEVNPSTVAAAKRVITTHRQVIRALAKR